MWYLALRHNRQPRAEWTVTIEEHLAWMRRQHEAGAILFSGPTPDRAMGIYVIRAVSRTEAERVAASDPFTAAGHCSFELIDWDVHQILGAGSFMPSPATPDAPRTAM